MAANRFFSSFVRIQSDRGHTVATGGPYRFVRHPGYAAFILGGLGIPLLLGSLWALVPASLSCVVVLVRTVLEDRTLREELPGGTAITPRASGGASCSSACTGSARRLGYTPDWYANEFRRDVDEAERLQKQGKSPMEIMAVTSYPSDGVEFAIRHSKLPGTRWLFRLGASVLADGKPGWLAHPAGTDERTTEGWQVLRLD